MNAGPWAIVFDLDDTLYLERDYARSGFIAVGDYVKKTAGLTDFADRCWTCFQQGTRGSIFDEALAGYRIAIEPSYVRELVRVYRQHEPTITLADDAAAWFDAHRGRQRVGLISDGPLICQERKFAALQLDESVQAAVLTDRWGRLYWKPHPRAFETISETLNTRPRDCVYVADNPQKDFAAPLELGWRTIRIRRPLGLHADVDVPAGMTAEVEITSLAELDSILESWQEQQAIGRAA
jgi:putative hydrolase of the HAD superfamily